MAGEGKTTADAGKRMRYELELTAPAEEWLRELSFTAQATEVPFYEQRIDLYAYSRERDTTMAVELKVGRWRRAVEQALLYQLCADLVVIGMPAETTGNADRSVLEEHGLGLIAIGRGRTTPVVKPRRSSVLRRDYRAQYIRLLQKLAETEERETR